MNVATGRKAAEMKAAHQAVMDERPATTKCAWCRWTHIGTVAAGRAAAIAHRLAAHPDVRPKRVRRNSLQRFSLGDQSFRDEGNANAAEVAAMLAHREGTAA